jgi:hypothetical protein
VALFLVTFGLVSSSTFAALRYAYPGRGGWLSTWVSLPWLAFYVFFYTFPSGKFVPKRTAVWAPIFLTTLLALFTWFPDAGNVAGFPLILVAFGSAVLAQVYRYVRVSSPTERAQTKWVTLAIAVIGVGEIVGQGLLPALFPRLVSDPSLKLRYGMGLTLGVPIFLLIPISVAIAILRYRLWDVDVIIRRTLIYSVLTAVLGVAYLGSVLVLQGVFQAMTGEGQSPLVVVLSTLGIAALFGPVRGRVQAAIDRHFYRRKYDAARTLAGFAASARDETDLEQLSTHLIGVVQETMQPAHASLWLSAVDKKATG